MEIINLERHKIGYERLTDSEQKFLLDLCVNDIHQYDHSKFLVGAVTKQITVSNLNELKRCLENKILNFVEHLRLEKNFVIQSSWYNVMQSGDYNPVHDHSGDLSFVVIFDQDEALVEEQKQDLHSGQLWFYASSDDGYISGMRARVGGGHFYIFKSSLDHAVYPFKTSTLRSSLAGNIVLN